MVSSLLLHIDVRLLCWQDTNFPFPWAQMIMILLVVHSVFTPCVATWQNLMSDEGPRSP